MRVRYAIMGARRTSPAHHGISYALGTSGMNGDSTLKPAAVALWKHEACAPNHCRIVPSNAGKRSSIST